MRRFLSDLATRPAAGALYSLAALFLLMMGACAPSTDEAPLAEPAAQTPVASEMPAESADPVTALSPAEAAAYLSETPEAQIVDVRTLEEVTASGVLEGATVLDFRAPAFGDRAVEALDPSKPVVLYCRSGNRAGQAADILAGLGFTTLFNAGGYDALATAGLSTESYTP